MDKHAFYGLARALRNMEMPPADAGFDDLLARIDIAVAGAAAPSWAARSGERREPRRPKMTGRSARLQALQRRTARPVG